MMRDTPNLAARLREVLGLRPDPTAFAPSASRPGALAPSAGTGERFAERIRAALRN